MKSKMSDALTFAAYTLAVIAIICVPLGCWIVRSHFEAESFNRITGKDISTWDAMFIELRVQEPAK